MGRVARSRLPRYTTTTGTPSFTFHGLFDFKGI